jgi:hypothetical protein
MVTLLLGAVQQFEPASCVSSDRQATPAGELPALVHQDEAIGAAHRRDHGVETKRLEGARGSITSALMPSPL